MEKYLAIPNLAGICSVKEAAVRGLSVDENVDILKRIHYVKKRLYDVMVRRMNSTPEWEVKGAMSLHLWLDAEHVAALRKRVSEMREPPLHMDKVPDDKLELLMNETLHADSTVKLLTGIRRIRLELAKAYREHRGATNPLVDHPTCRVIKIMAMEEAEMLDWVTEALHSLLQTSEQRTESTEWDEHLNAYLQYARGIFGNEPSIDRSTLPPRRAIETYRLDLVPRRDRRFTDLYNSVLSADEIYLDRERDAKERVWALFYKRLREIDVPEMMCSIVAQTADKPWEYYQDMGRQIWDEARHSMMGEAAFSINEVKWTNLPIRINFSLELNTMLTPEERHAILYEIEFGLMPADKGKKYEWETSKQTEYELAVTFHDYDWADEVLHAQIGRKWIVSQLGGVPQTLELAKQAYKKLADNRPIYKSDDPDWWQRFYETVKDKPFAMEQYRLAGSGGG